MTAMALNRDFTASPASLALRGRMSDREDRLLASYAFHSIDSQGRQYSESPHAYRGPFERDRDRILHCSAFRRLSGKMQVFTGDMGEYHRTRLTHTFEVASIARTMGRVLRLNEDLIEALALMHDIGHPPYGHCGEDILNECLADCQGFSHNRFALVIVQELEERYQDFPGLNLSAEVLAGQQTRANKQAAALAGIAPLLEVQIVDAADSIAYDSHDVDDALQLGLLSLDDLLPLRLVRRASERIQQRSGLLPRDRWRTALVHELIDLQVGDFVASAEEKLFEKQGHRAHELCNANVVLGHTEPMAQERRELEQFLFDRVYRHPRLMQVRSAAEARLRELFVGLCRNPDRLPMRFRRRAERVGIPEAIGEFIAGMTDRFCDSQHEFLKNGSGPLGAW
jgi:dGTPase